MDKDIGLSELIFDYYKSRILFGYCKYGDSLPSILGICEVWQLGGNTVRRAFDSLEERGYIRSEERRGSIVAYKGTPEIFEKNRAEYLVPREEGIRDFFKAAKLLLRPVWESILREAERSDRVTPYRKQVEKLIKASPPAVKFYIEKVLPMGNSLLTSLYWESLRYVNFSYANRNWSPLGERAEEGQKSGQDLPAAGGTYDDAQEEVLEFIAKARKKYHLEGTAQIPFKWNIYRRRPQIRYSLATIIIQEIICGRYPIDSFLPSLAQMAEEHGVSLNTARRAVAMLNSLGVTKSYHGRGTKICIEPVPIDFSAPDIQENLRRHRESLDLMAMTIRGVLLFTLKSASKEKREKLKRHFAEIIMDHRGILGFNAAVGFICEECPSAMVRECYARLREYVMWGYVLSLGLLKSEEFHAKFTEAVRPMAESLEKDDLTAFADGWQRLMESVAEGVPKAEVMKNCKS